MHHLGRNRPLNQCLRPDDPQYGGPDIEGYQGSTPAAHVRLPLSRVSKGGGMDYPTDRAGLQELRATEHGMGPTRQGFNDSAKRISSMAAHLQQGGKLPEVVGERLPDGQVLVWDGYHRISASKIAGHDSIDAFVAPPRKPR
jgi:hypothetical protein